MLSLNIDDKTIEEILKKVRVIVKEEIVAAKKFDDGDQLISVDAVRRMFTPPISRNTLRSWCEQGRIPYYKIGGRVLYKRNEVLGAAATLKKYKR
jgi:excisionase family DNA binding protein